MTTSIQCSPSIRVLLEDPLPVYQNTLHRYLSTHAAISYFNNQAPANIFQYADKRTILLYGILRPHTTTRIHKTSDRQADLLSGRCQESVLERSVCQVRGVPRMNSQCPMTKYLLDIIRMGDRWVITMGGLGTRFLEVAEAYGITRYQCT